MKTLFDLRLRQDDDLHEAIQKRYEEPLKIITFEDQPITACMGCFGCWVRTPGRCVMKDRMSASYADYVNSDTVILVMETAQGFISQQAKAFIDRTIPHYHPYIEVEDAECHHLARYERYPDMVFYYDPEGLTGEEDQVIEDYLYRTAYQFKSEAYRAVRAGGLQLHKLEYRQPKNRVLPFASGEPMERLVIYNGSPRRTGSNSALILKAAVEVLGDRVEVRDLKESGKWAEWAEAFRDEWNVMFFMPLYVHAMPSHVKAFMEKLKPSQGTISYFVQSGFPESAQSHYLEAYLELLGARLGRTYLGTAIKGGVEGFQTRPAKTQKKIMDPMVRTIANLVQGGKFNPKDIRQLAIPVRFGKTIEMVFNGLAWMGITTNTLWDRQLKANQAYEKRFDRPYLSTDEGNPKA